MKGLRRELARVGIRGRLARRIAAELDDHLACDPDANLGEPALIADRFAQELALPKTRRATYVAFAALALLALLLPLAQRPGVDGGLVVALAGVVIILTSQVAFVAGVLAVWGLRRGAPTAVVQRRVVVAAIAGVVVAAAVCVAAVAVQDWRALAALVPLPFLAAAVRETRVAATDGVARGFSTAEAASLGVLVVAAMTFGSAVAESSWFEGVSRGAVEAVAFASGFVLLGRRLGIRR